MLRHRSPLLGEHQLDDALLGPPVEPLEGQRVVRPAVAAGDDADDPRLGRQLERRIGQAELDADAIVHPQRAVDGHLQPRRPRCRASARAAARRARPRPIARAAREPHPQEIPPLIL